MESGSHRSKWGSSHLLAACSCDHILHSQSPFSSLSLSPRFSSSPFRYSPTPPFLLRILYHPTHSFNQTIFSRNCCSCYSYSYCINQRFTIQPFVSCCLYSIHRGKYYWLLIFHKWPLHFQENLSCVRMNCQQNSLTLKKVESLRVRASKKPDTSFYLI